MKMGLFLDPTTELENYRAIYILKIHVLNDKYHGRLFSDKILCFQIFLYTKYNTILRCIFCCFVKKECYITTANSFFHKNVVY